MRAVVQRVKDASVTIDHQKITHINKGLVILVGIGKQDILKDVIYIADKVVNLRIFPDENQNMNLSGLDVGAELLVVSQFTLYGDCRKGKRPDFTRAAPPELAEKLYNEFVNRLREYPLKVVTGKFRAMMTVNINNDGPVTLIVESPNG